MATKENANKIRLLLVAGMTVERIAEEIGVSTPTLRKHYFQNGKVKAAQAKAMARAEQKAKVLIKLDEQVEAGNVSAMKEMNQLIDRARLEEMPTAPKGKSTPALASMGKKDQRKARAGRVPAAIEDLVASSGDTTH